MKPSGLGVSLLGGCLLLIWSPSWSMEIFYVFFTGLYVFQNLFRPDFSICWHIAVQSNPWWLIVWFLCYLLQYLLFISDFVILGLLPFHFLKILVGAMMYYLFFQEKSSSHHCSFVSVCFLSLILMISFFVLILSFICSCFSASEVHC